MRFGSASSFGISLIIPPPPLGSLTVVLFRKHNLMSLRGNRICHSRRLYRNQQEVRLFLVFCLVPYFSPLADILLWLLDPRSLLFHHFLIFFGLSFRKTVPLFHMLSICIGTINVLIEMFALI